MNLIKHTYDIKLFLIVVVVEREGVLVHTVAELADDRIPKPEKVAFDVVAWKGSKRKFVNGIFAVLQHA